VFCPDCGHRNEEGDRFCSNCGGALQRKAAATPRRSLRERAVAVIGGSRRERLVTAATVAAVAVAGAAYLALRPTEEGVPRDDYTLAAEQICVDAKTQIAAAGESTAGNLGRYGSEIVPLATDWLTQFKALQTPADRTAYAAEMRQALLEVIIQAGILARVGREGPPADVVAQAGRVDAASAGVEQAIKDLRLDRCAEVRIGPRPSG
jgi:hypothetical protein